MLTSPETLNPYLYTLNNPVNFSDPSGEFIFAIPLVTFIGLAAIGGFLGGVGYYTLQAYLNADPCLGMQWNLGEALMWGGVGTGMGALLGAGIYGGWWLGTQLWAWLAPPTTVTLYRFANSLSDLTSRASSKVQAQVSMSQAELLIRAEQHAMGYVENSPFISTLANPYAGAATTDPWLRSIISGAQYLYTLQVPNNLLYYPSNALSQMETEVLVLANTVAPYVVQVINNPFLK